MENFERLSNKILIRTCHCGIVFETYDPKKMYHSNKCGTLHLRKKYEVVHRRELKSKKSSEQSFL
jgi:hypothetical protein